MNAAACQQAMAEVGTGLAASLKGVDCVTMGSTQAAFGRLFGTNGVLLPSLTILLTLYVGFFAVQLLTGRSRLSVGALTPRMMTLGLVLTFATSWVAYSQVVWNLALGAPDQIASIISGMHGSATDLFAQKIDILFQVIGEAATAGKPGQDAATAAAVVPPSIVSPEGMLWLGSVLLLLGTAGVLVTCRIALAVLIAVGPVFVVLALFNGTRGLFAGWLKGVILLSIAPLFAVLGGSLMLELAVPVIRMLIEVPGQIDPRAAMAFFMIGAIHIALMSLVMKVATTMVAGWSVFGLAAGERESKDKGADMKAARSAATPAQPASASASSGAGQRRIAVSAVPTGGAANDAGGGMTDSRFATNVHVIQGDRSLPLAASGASTRARGIGSRFRASPTRSTEKIR